MRLLYSLPLKLTQLLTSDASQSSEKAMANVSKLPVFRAVSARCSMLSAQTLRLQTKPTNAYMGKWIPEAERVVDIPGTTNEPGELVPGVDLREGLCLKNQRREWAFRQRRSQRIMCYVLWLLVPYLSPMVSCLSPVETEIEGRVFLKNSVRQEVWTLLLGAWRPGMTAR